jgi:NADH:ubiquinone oxidoreductase subunit E
MSVDTELEIVICMGSSCFARGNAENLRVLKEYLEHNQLNASVLVRGQLCHEQCKSGPNVMIQGRMFNEVSPTSLIPLVEAEFKMRSGR